MAKQTKNTNNNKNIVSGRNIYTDSHGRTVFYSSMRKQGFVVKAGTETAFKAFSNRFLVGFIAIVFLEIFFLHNLIFSIPAGIGVYAYMEYRWRKLLNSYTMIQDFKPDEHESSFQMIVNMDTGAIVLRSVLYIALSICLILNIYVTPEIESSILLTVSSYFLSVLALYMAGRYIYAISKKSK